MATTRSRGTSRASPFPGVMGGDSSPNMRRGASEPRFPPSDPSGSRLPALTPAERAYMERKAKEASVALIDHAHTLDGPVQWHYTGKFRGIQMYRGEGSFENAATAGTEFLCGVTTMLGSIEEVAWFFDQRTTEQMRARQTDDVLDAGVLYSLVNGVSGNPFYRVSVKYQSFEGPSRFSRARDYCFLECQDTFRHASGRRGWVLSMHSIKLPSCPELDGIVRGSMYHSGYVFVEAEREGYMDVMHSLQINFKSTSRLPHFLLNAALKRRILSVVKISREIQMSRMGRHALLKKKQLMPKNSRSQCQNCSRKFSLFVRKTRCRMCGEVVCQACAPVMEVDVPGRPITKTRICSKCYSTSPTMESEDDFPVSTQSENVPSYDQIRRDQNETQYSLIRRDENGTHYSFSRADENATNYDGMVAKNAIASKALPAEDDDDLDADSDDDGLEEQSSVSVFAQSRFTRTSADSMVLPVAPDIDEGEIERYSEVSSAFWKESSLGSSGWKTPSPNKYATKAPSPNKNANTTFDPTASSSDSVFGASQFLTPEDTDEELDKRARRYNPTLSIRDYSREYGRVSRPARPSNSSRPSLPPPPPPYSPSIEETDDNENYRALDASVLRAHNSRPQKQADGPLMTERKIYGSDDESGGENDKNFANKKDRRASKMAKRGEKAADEPALRDTTSSAILSQVRANRSRTIQFSPEGDYRSPEAMAQITAEHEKRMEDIRQMQAKKDARESTPSLVAESPPSVPPSRLSSDKSERPKNGSASVSSSRSSSTKLGSPEQRPVSVTSSGSSSSKSGGRAQSIASASSAKSFSIQRQGSDTSSKRASYNAHENAATASIAKTRPSNGDSERSSGDKGDATVAEVKEATTTFEATSNSKLISIRTSRAVGARTTGTFSEDGVRVSGPPSEQLGDLTFESPPRDPEPTANFVSRASETVPFSDVAILEDAAGRRSTVVLLERISSPRESTTFDEDLINRPTEDLMQEVNLRRNASGPRVPDEEFRSTETMLSIEEAHRLRMEELNRIALDNMGSRISHLMDSGADDDDYDELAMSRTRVKRSGTFVLSEDEVERSTEVMEDMALEHQRRMDELNRIAVENVGTRISKFGVEEDDEDGEPVEVDVDTTSPFLGPQNPDRRSASEFEQSHLEFVPTISEETTYSSELASLKQTFGSSSSTEFSEHHSSPRESHMSDMSDLDEDLINRPTEDLMDQVRANRSRKLVNVSSMSSGYHSKASMLDMEKRHKERMAELNKLALDKVGHRISKLGTDDDDEPAGAHRDMSWRNTDIMEGFQSEHDRKMEALREKLRQLEFECRESIASVLTPEEIELEDEAFDADPVVRHSDTSWIGSAKPSKLLRTTRTLPPRVDEPVSASTLYEQIAELSKLQREMALAKNEGDEEEFRGRIKEQYRLLRSIKLRGW